ncbi:T9SS type A sorting domain-containing protein [Chryseobacterium sp. MEBOG06]|uniref:T9SS-dependent choice-of-anchor J family protein n=1 Tax=unclassified Chryseobacterium TaxID=2593645 RepID=UPI001F3A26A6|nr:MULTISPECIES: choice-of-anchor J domain-containing protein [unclassified Chryseobacterium]UKB84141.1 T9SS type A sorting domain-containing protein [Chryseobacterium sp. MEBOG06]
MKRIILSLSLLLGTIAHSQTVLLDEGFESYTNFAITGFGSWLTLDLDGLSTFYGGGPSLGGVPSATWNPNWLNAGSPMAFQIFNPSATNATNNLTVTATDDEIRNFTPHGGQKYAAAWAGSPTPSVPGNNDWLITPAVTLGATSNSLTFWVKALSPDYVESYKVGVYTGSGTPTAASNFTIISGASARTAPYAGWQQVTLSLDAYAGQTVRVGFQYMSSNEYMFMLDDVKITTAAVLSTNEISKTKSNVALYPNPTQGEVSIKTDKKIKSTSIVDMTGKTVNSTNSEKADLSSLPKGNYLLKVDFSDGTTTTEKVIKQ